MIRSFSIGLIAVLVLATASGRAQAPDLESMDIVLKSIPDGPIAKVNGVNIEQQDFVNLYQADLQRYLATSGEASVQDSVRIQIAFQSLQVLLRYETLHQEALAHSLSVPEAEIEATWAEQLEQFEQTLSGEGGVLSELEVLDRIGMANREEALERIERMMLIEAMSAKVIAEAGNEMVVTDEQVAAVIERQSEKLGRQAVYKVRQILIRATAGDSDSRSRARAQINEALTRLQSGESFAGLAEEMSEAPGREKGGEVVGTERQFPPFMVEAISSLALEEISDVVESEYGFHLFKLIERKAGSDESATVVSDEIRLRLKSARGEQVVRDYCTRLWESGMQWEHYLEIEKNLAINPDYRDQGSQ